jgi:hypothetical protein
MPGKCPLFFQDGFILGRTTEIFPAALMRRSESNWNAAFTTQAAK